MPGFADVVRTLDRLGAVVSIGGRTLLSVDTNPVPNGWTHITKVDPEEDKQLPLAYPLYLSHTGAVSVGGSQDVTEENTLETFDLVDAATVPAFHEPSEATHVTERVHERAKFMAVPEVLNGDNESLVGTLGKSIEYGKEEMAPRLIAEKVPIPLGDTIETRLSNFLTSWLFHEAVFEGYIIMNPDSAAAREANVSEDDLLSPREAKQHAIAAEYHLESEVVYLEYSGTFGGEEAVEILDAIDDGVCWSRIWYGGGLDDRESAQTVLDAGADAVVVGNVFHDIAAEEADLADRAQEELGPDTTREAVEEWLQDAVDVSDTAAARYLATITDVPDPETRGARYLAAGIHAALELTDIASRLDAPDESRLREALGESVPTETAFVDAMGKDARELAFDLALALLAERFDVTLEKNLPVHHVGISL